MDERTDALRRELRNEIEAASLFLDDSLYTTQSYFALVMAIGCAKVACADKSADDRALKRAQGELCEAVDAMELRPTKKKEHKHARKRDFAPYLLAGAFCGGVIVGCRLAGKYHAVTNRKEHKHE